QAIPYLRNLTFLNSSTHIRNGSCALGLKMAHILRSNTLAFDLFGYYQMKECHFPISTSILFSAMQWLNMLVIRRIKPLLSEKLVGSVSVCSLSLLTSS